MASWDTGYGDFEMKPDFDTLRLVPWHAKTAMCMADLQWHDDRPVAPSPRQILRRQLDRLAERGWTAFAATELEFIVFRDTYEEAFHKRYQGLEPGNLYNVDYSMLGTSRLEPLLGRIRREMAGAGLRVENSKGECNFGQHEINFTYEGALGAADTHTIYKNGAKEIASQEGMAITFMAKYDEREGNSCHVHLSVRGEDGTPVFAEQPELFDRFVAGQLACLRELTLFKAPNVNSYKRFAEGSFAPTAVAWGRDNRTCSMRVIGHGPSLRLESRLAGGDVNPYLALAAMIASGLHGIDNELELEPALEGNAYTADKPHVPVDAVRRARAVRRQRRRAGGVRAGGRRPLPQLRRRRVARLRGGGHRLGALPGLRAAVTRPGHRDLRGRRAGALDVLGPGGGGAADAPTSGTSSVRAGSPWCCRRTRRPATSCCGCSTASCYRRRRHRRRSRARRLRAGARRAGARARRAVPGRLPRDAGDERRPRRHADRAPARRGRPRGPPSGARRVRRPRRAPAGGLARPARRPRGHPPDEVAPPPGRRPARRRASRSPAGRPWTTCPRRSRTPRKRFALGVQWHPEADEESPLIAALVDEARSR